MNKNVKYKRKKSQPDIVEVVIFDGKEETFNRIQELYRMNEESAPHLEYFPNTLEWNYNRHDMNYDPHHKFPVGSAVILFEDNSIDIRDNREDFESAYEKEK